MQAAAAARVAGRRDILNSAENGDGVSVLCHLIADADAVIEILKQNNIPILSGPKLRPDGYVQVFISDPDGHMVELCSVAK